MYTMYIRGDMGAPGGTPFLHSPQQRQLKPQQLQQEQQHSEQQLSEQQYYAYQDAQVAQDVALQQRLQTANASSSHQRCCSCCILVRVAAATVANSVIW